MHIEKKETEARDVNNINFPRMSKWSSSTILKFIERVHWQTVNDILHNDEYSNEDKNIHINKWLDTFLSIYKPIHDWGLDWRKE